MWWFVQKALLGGRGDLSNILDGLEAKVSFFAQANYTMILLSFRLFFTLFI